MQGWLTVVAGIAVLVIHAMALLIIVVGTIGAFLRSIRAVFRTSGDGHLFRDAAAGARRRGGSMIFVLSQG